MPALAFALWLTLACSNITHGCTVEQVASDLTHIDCLMAGAMAVQRHEAIEFHCVFERPGQKT